MCNAEQIIMWREFNCFHHANAHSTAHTQLDSEIAYTRTTRAQFTSQTNKHRMRSIDWRTPRTHTPHTHTAPFQRIAIYIASQTHTKKSASKKEEEQECRIESDMLAAHSSYMYRTIINDVYANYHCNKHSDASVFSFIKLKNKIKLKCNTVVVVVVVHSMPVCVSAVNKCE